MLESLFDKATDLKACNFIKKKFQHRCFPVKCAKFVRTPFFYRTSPVAASDFNLFFTLSCWILDVQRGIGVKLWFIFHFSISFRQVNHFVTFYLMIDDATLLSWEADNYIFQNNGLAHSFCQILPHFVSKMFFCMIIKSKVVKRSEKKRSKTSHVVQF